MPTNRNALIRYKTIDQCLQNRFRRWTLDDLVEACSEALYEYEGIDKGVSRRTVQADIQMMRSEKLGYNAPIIVQEKKYYTYADPGYSITNIPLSAQDLNKLEEVVEILRQFKGFDHFKDLRGIVQRLEDKILSKRLEQSPIIDFEKNEALKGLENLDQLYQSILKKQALEISYKSFRALGEHQYLFHPYLLKEYRNRWFVLGKRGREQNYTLLALDRIIQIKKSEQAFLPANQEEVLSYFQPIIGVTVLQNQDPERVILFVDKQSAPYVLTKPLHESQQLIEALANGIIIAIQVMHNYELEREILGFGDSIQVLEPAGLQKRIQRRLQMAYEQYESTLKKTQITHYLEVYRQSGTAIFPKIYTSKECNRMISIIHKYFRKYPEAKKSNPYSIRKLLFKVPELKNVIFNRNLHQIIDNLDTEAFLVKSQYLDKDQDWNWYVSWHQDQTIHLKEKKAISGFHSWTKKEDWFAVIPPQEIARKMFTIRIHLDDTDESNGALKVIPGSHHKIYSADEIQQIVKEKAKQNCAVVKGGGHLLHPHLLHASSENQVEKSRKVIHLEFCSAALPDLLQWSERIRQGSFPQESPS